MSIQTTDSSSPTPILDRFSREKYIQKTAYEYGIDDFAQRPTINIAKEKATGYCTREGCTLLVCQLRLAAEVKVGPWDGNREVEKEAGKAALNMLAYHLFGDILEQVNLAKLEAYNGSREGVVKALDNIIKLTEPGNKGWEGAEAKPVQRYFTNERYL